MGMDQERNSNIMMGRNMMGQDSMGRNMMRQGNTRQNIKGRNIYSNMSNRGMTADMSNVMGQGKTLDVMGRNMMGQDRTSQMIRHKMIGQQNMTPNMMYNNMMDQGMLVMTNKQLSSNNRLKGQRMMQQMERIP